MKSSLRFRFLYVVIILSTLSGCSFTGKFNESIVSAGAASWKMQPLAVRQSYPEWFQSVYLTAEMQTSEIKSWQLYVLSDETLNDIAHLAYAEIRYREGKETKVHEFPLYLVQTQLPDDEHKGYRYTYQFGNETDGFYSNYLTRRFSYQVSPIDVHYLQPYFRSDQIKTNTISVEYGILPEYGPKTVGELMRSMFHLRQKDWQKFCQDPVYIYSKSTACGDVKITEMDNRIF